MNKKTKAYILTLLYDERKRVTERLPYEGQQEDYTEAFDTYTLIRSL